MHHNKQREWCIQYVLSSPIILKSSQLIVQTPFIDRGLHLYWFRYVLKMSGFAFSHLKTHIYWSYFNYKHGCKGELANVFEEFWKIRFYVLKIIFFHKRLPLPWAKNKCLKHSRDAKPCARKTQRPLSEEESEVWRHSKMNRHPILSDLCCERHEYYLVKC